MTAPPPLFLTKILQLFFHNSTTISLSITVDIAALNKNMKGNFFSVFAVKAYIETGGM
jgi:hypothetical protein